MSNPRTPSRSGRSKPGDSRGKPRSGATAGARPAPRPFDPDRAPPAKGSATDRLMNAQPAYSRPGSGGGRSESGAGFDRGADRTEFGAERPVQPAFVHKPRQPPMTIRLDQIRKVLDEVLTMRFAADSVVSHWFRAHPSLGIRDRAEVAESVYDVLRNLRLYRQLAESGVGNAVRRLAIQGALSTMDPEKVKAVLDVGELAWLDRIAQIDPLSMSLPVRESLPDWLYDRIKDYPEIESLTHALNQHASLDIRVNPLKAERDEMLADLTRGNAVRHAPVATPFSPWGIRLKGRPAMNKWHQFEHGLIEVQDEGSQLLALLVGPKRGEMVIDFCAGAGGKTLLLGALMRSTGRLYAFDVSATRLARAKPRFARSGLSNVVPVAIDHENDQRVRRLAGKAHRVLVDAPCSGVGTLRRNPDLKWRQSVQSLGELVDLQARILASASRCVAPGGRLVYATCSLLVEENENQAEKFLAEHPDFELIDAAPLLAARTPLVIEGPYLKLRPDVHGTDGFFAAVFERRKQSAVDVTGAVAADGADAGAGADAQTAAPAAKALKEVPKSPKLKKVAAPDVVQDEVNDVQDSIVQDSVVIEHETAAGAADESLVSASRAAVVPGENAQIIENDEKPDATLKPAPKKIPFRRAKKKTESL
ncbi:MAG: RsmB/NOP family class I SAM-dependent RNA methyltransferase [Sheuella sp.]|nr:RsmB/NOP family class I SAM-dependent RNA methyltransferase [Sheuella sp.]